ncbi:hypothetical protein [Risungbinella massiliensis]|uniref:hypothetical protein n=1 Tax=Risungbinella massiliensis TaxID=1329796 RepID=UPI0005CC7B9C|nr:hypothetical protein [Risungbinella massiliensis]
MDKMITKLEEMLSAMSQVNNEWGNLSYEEQDQLAENYPFDKSFDELVAEVDVWIDYIKNTRTKGD